MKISHNRRHLPPGIRTSAHPVAIAGPEYSCFKTVVSSLQKLTGKRTQHPVVLVFSGFLAPLHRSKARCEVRIHCSELYSFEFFRGRHNIDARRAGFYFRQHINQNYLPGSHNVCWVASNAEPCLYPRFRYFKRGLGRRARSTRACRAAPEAWFRCHISYVGAFSSVAA